MKYVYYIEGQDNIGKSTIIEELKRRELVNPKTTIDYHKFPTHRMTNYMTLFNNLLNDMKFNNRVSKEDIGKLIEVTMDILINDMKYTFGNYSILDQAEINICDRGPLSTYLYQYKQYCEVMGIDLPEEVNLHNFFYNVVLSDDSNKIPLVINRNIILLTNEYNIELPKDNTETIEYKNEYDNNQKLQDRIKTDINTIKDLVKSNKGQYSIGHFNFYTVDIGTTVDSKLNKGRKSVEDICNEIEDIVVFNYLNSKLNKYGEKLPS